MSAAAPTSVSEPLETPSLRRRLACFTYEGVLLFGVLVIADYLFASLTQQKHALQLREAGMAFLFVVLGIYFVWFWSHGGQTVAMKAWHIRVVDRDGRPVTELRGLARYLLGWLWFAPTLLALYGWDIHEGATISAVLIAGVAGYALTPWLHPSRQFPHDVLAGTRLVSWRPAG